MWRDRDPPAVRRLRQQLGNGFGCRPGLGLFAGWVGGFADADGAAVAGGVVVLLSAGEGGADVPVDVDVSVGVGLGFALGPGGGDVDVVPGLGEVGLHDGGTVERDPVPAGP